MNKLVVLVFVAVAICCCKPETAAPSQTWRLNVAPGENPTKPWILDVLYCKAKGVTSANPGACDDQTQKRSASEQLRIVEEAFACWQDETCRNSSNLPEDLFRLESGYETKRMPRKVAARLDRNGYALDVDL